MPVVTAVIAGGVKITHDVIKHHNLAKTEQLKTMYCYDPQLGHYWKLKRELSNRDWLEINTRKRHGEDLGSILNTMNVLD